jgi:hypothetical protein
MTLLQQGSDAVNSKQMKRIFMSSPEPCTGTTMTTHVRSGFRSVHDSGLGKQSGAMC